jgi:hypothetical protein
VKKQTSSNEVTGEAFGWLERAHSEHSNVVTTLKVDPISDLVRSDPRFENLGRRLGVAALSRCFAHATSICPN